MPKRGDIMIERLTGKRVIVIRTDGEDVTCRFADGRLEERFAFELEIPPALVDTLVSFLLSLFASASNPRLAFLAVQRPRFVAS